MLVPFGTRAAVGIQRMLEDAGHQDAFVAGDDVLGAVAVVHVEVDHGHALQAALVQRMARRHRHVVEEAEAHCRGRASAWWPGGRTAQKALCAVPSITASVAATAAPAARRRGVPAAGAGAGVGIDLAMLTAVLQRRHRLAQLGHVQRRMCALQSAHRGQRGLASVERVDQAGRDQVVVRWRPAASGHSGWPRPMKCARQSGWL